MKHIRVLILLFLFISPAQLLNAAPPPPPAGTPGCWPPPCIPIDGGISVLIAAGAAYGAKKLYNSRKKNSKVS